MANHLVSSQVWYNKAMAKEIDPSKYMVNQGERVYTGAHSSIDAVKLSIGKHEVPLLRKKHIGYSADFMSGPQWHSFLKKKGYPMFPTWRYDAGEQIDFITDLRRKGTHKLIDFCGHEDNYKKVFISNLGDLDSQAEMLSSKLADDGIVINEPNIFFDVEISTGIARIILGDLREMGYESQDAKDASREQILSHDKSIIEGHMSRLKDIMVEEAE